jgi:arabinofuranan 3-O-arabinosyltransferase
VNRGRVVHYCRAILLGYAIALPLLWLRMGWPVDADGFPADSDFVNVWAAGYLAAAGQAAAIYDWEIHKQIENLALGREFEGYYGWHYPPIFLFVATPLSLLPYLVSYVAWVGFSLFAFIRLLGPVLRLPTSTIALPLLTAPATFYCALAGQNGMLTAGLMAGSLALIERRPWLSGVLLGLLCYKPQYGLLFPLVLAVAGRWRVFAAAAVTALAITGASALVFGAEAWAAFADSLTVSMHEVLRRGGSSWPKLQSIYAMAYQITGHDSVAWAAHAAGIAATLAVLIPLWRGTAPLAVKAAAMTAGAFLATPYAYVYDAPVLLAGTAFLVRDGLDRGFRSYDRVLLALCWLIPALFNIAGSITVPLVGALLLFLAVRRAGPAQTWREAPIRRSAVPAS